MKYTSIIALTLLNCCYSNAANLTFFNETPAPLTIKMYSKKTNPIITQRISPKRLTTISYKPQQRLKLEIFDGTKLIKTVHDKEYLEKYTHFTITSCLGRLTVGGTGSAEGQTFTSCQSRWFDDEGPPYPHSPVYIEIR